MFLACVVICRGEDDYLIEWIEFHRMMGVEHFFVYDNGIEPATKELLKSYIADWIGQPHSLRRRELARPEERLV